MKLIWIGIDEDGKTFLLGDQVPGLKPIDPEYMEFLSPDSQDFNSGEWPQSSIKEGFLELANALKEAWGDNTNSAKFIVEQNKLKTAMGKVTTIIGGAQPKVFVGAVEYDTSMLIQF